MSSEYTNLFDDDLQKLANKYFDNDEANDDKIQKYLFDECMLQARRARKFGKTHCRYSFLMICFAIALRLKIGMGSYDHIAKTFHLPTGRIVNKYSSPDTNSPDGLMFESLSNERHRFESKRGYVKLEFVPGRYFCNYFFRANLK